MSSIKNLPPKNRFAHSGQALKNLPAHERPREKMIEKGSENLKNKELLAILLGTGRAGKSVLEVADHIIIAKDNLQSII